MKPYFSFYCSLLCLFACHTPPAQSPHDFAAFKSEKNKITRYAHEMSIWEFDTCYLIEVKEAPETITSLIVSKNKRSYANKTIVFSSVFTGFLSALQLQSHIVGVDDIDFIHDSLLQSKAARNALPSLKKGGKLSIESLMGLQADWILHSDFDVFPASLLQKLKASATRFLMCNNYKENNPLGRAEWIKLFGILYGEKEKAFSLFEEVETHYKEIARRVRVREKTVLTGAIYGGFWNVPGAHSYTAQLIHDAGGVYLFNNKKESYYYALSLEEVVQQGLDAKLWIHIGSFQSQREMLVNEPRYASFHAFKTQALFNNNKQMNATGGNAFWESGPVRPDWVLQDLYRIIHGQTDSLIYYQKLPES